MESKNNQTRTKIIQKKIMGLINKQSINFHRKKPQFWNANKNSIFNIDTNINLVYLESII
jgi:hypothetical protein